jgi:hypothetical protein
MLFSLSQQILISACSCRRQLPSTKSTFICKRRLTLACNPQSDLSSTRILNVILVRHAESTNNTLNHTPLGTCVNSDPLSATKRSRESDCGLSDRGKLQLQHLHNFVKEKHWRDVYHSKTKIFSSPMLRCLETTASITTAIHATSNCLPNVSVHPNLFEYGGCYSYGDDRSTQASPGLSQTEVEGRYAGYKCLEGIPHGLGGMLHYPHFTPHFTSLLTSLHSSQYFTSHFTSLLTSHRYGKRMVCGQIKQRDTSRISKAHDCNGELAVGSCRNRRRDRSEIDNPYY